jgi:hypothetical protein
LVSVGYIGSAGINLIDAINVNPTAANARGQYSTLDASGRVVLNDRINSSRIPGSNVTAYGTMTDDLVSGHSSYNSLQTSVNHPLSHDVQMQFITPSPSAWMRIPSRQDKSYAPPIRPGPTLTIRR